MIEARRRQRIISAAFLLLPFQKANVFINRCPAQITHPSQLAYIQLPLLVGGIVAEEHGGNIVCGCLRSADLGSFGSGICIPDLTRSRMIRNSNSANTPDI